MEATREKHEEERDKAWSGVGTSVSNAAIVATVVISGKTYVVLRNPWGQTVVADNDDFRQQSQTKPLYVKRDAELVEEDADEESIEQALAYCKAEESANKTCGFTLASGCPKGWNFGKTFVVEGETYTACIYLYTEVQK